MLLDHGLNGVISFYYQHCVYKFIKIYIQGEWKIWINVRIYKLQPVRVVTNYVYSM